VRCLGGFPAWIFARSKPPGKEFSKFNLVAFRLAPEWKSIRFNELTCPDYSGKCGHAPEEYGIGPENWKATSSTIMSDAAQPRPPVDVPTRRGPAGVAEGKPGRAPSEARAVDFPAHGGLDRRKGRHEPEIPVQGGTRCRISLNAITRFKPFKGLARSQIDNKIPYKAIKVS
jgi:hypothetical protein